MRHVRTQAAVFAVVWLAAALCQAGESGVVAPRVHARGVEAATAEAFELLLVQEIEGRTGEELLRIPARAGAGRACAAADCAARRARELGARAALLCTLARLGRKHVATLQLVDAAGRVAWTERTTASRVEDLDGMASQLGAAAARSLASEAPPDDGGERPDPGPDPQDKRRGWSGKGPRAGALYPVAHSYAGVERLTSVAYTWRYQTPSFNVESVPILGLAWGGDLERDHGKARDWTILDVYVTWTPARGDLAPYAGAGMGLHGVRLEHDGTGLGFAGSPRHQMSTALSLQLGSGLVLLRTYDFQICVDLRYQHLLNDFADVGGGGARGIALTFGLQHR